LPRQKGRASLKSNESEFSHHLGMMALEGGFGARPNAMHKWHKLLAFPLSVARDGVRMDALYPMLFR